MSNLLGIAIPTFNRVDILIENLNIMLPSILEYNIKIYISDDSTNLDTYDCIDKFVKLYPNIIFYVKNSPRLGHDFNCISSLMLALEENDYVLYLNDSSFIDTNSFSILIDELTNNCVSAVILNAANRITANIPKEIFDRNVFVNYLAWHATKTGVTVYNSEILKPILENKKYEKYLNTNFIQLGLLFELLFSCELPFLWLKNISILDNSKKKNSYWYKDTIKVFAYDWDNFCSKLNFISREQQIHLMQTHTEKSKLFDFMDLCLLRSNGGISLKDIVKYRDNIARVNKNKFLSLIIVSLFPVWLMRFVKNIKEILR